MYIHIYIHTYIYIHICMFYTMLTNYVIVLYIYIYHNIRIYGTGLQPHPPVMVMVPRPPVGMGGLLYV